MNAPVVIGVLGAGAIARPYYLAIKAWPNLRLKACSSRTVESARREAAHHGIAAAPVAQMLADPEIEIVVNLTPMQAHFETSSAILRAGKHLFSEKPLAVTFADGQELTRLAAEHGVRIGCAPDTFLGAAHQAARAVIDAGAIGRVKGGAAFVGSRGVAEWHPHPEPYYAKGGGPFADHGPYYLTQLINLLGPIKRVSAFATEAGGERPLGSRNRQGQMIPIEAPTFTHALLLFENGANVTLTTAWEMWKHERQAIEIYGDCGTLLNPDPNWSDGSVRVSVRGEPWREIEHGDRPFHAPTMITFFGTNVANYRTAGLADMAEALRENRPHRANGDLALHVLEAIDAAHRSSAEGVHIDLRTRCERPHALTNVGAEMRNYAPFGGEPLDSRKLF
jgi:predicted dehydrogenase